jgi:hypothetical protein
MSRLRPVPESAADASFAVEFNPQAQYNPPPILKSGAGRR